MPPLTRNLYREDEVVAAFKWCALRGRAEEAIFWAKELLDTELRATLWEAMLWVWIHGVGIADPYWLDRFAFMNGPVEDSQLMTTVMALFRNPGERRDATVVALLGLGLSEACLKDFVGQPPLPTFRQSMSAAALTAAKAVIQGKTAFAWGLLRGLFTAETTDSWTILEDCCAPGPKREWIQFLRGQATRFPLLTWPLRAAALVLAVYDAPRAPVVAWTPPAEWTTYASSLDGLRGRARRQKEPPTACLFLATARGWTRVTETTEAELMETLEECLPAAAFWRERLPVASDDDAREAFVETWFPDDIPDEWSVAARRISHGYGALPTGPPPDYRNMLRAALTRWFGNLPSKVWDGLGAGIRELVARWPEDGNRLVAFDLGIPTLYRGPAAEPQDEALVAAVRRLIL